MALLQPFGGPPVSKGLPCFEKVAGQLLGWNIAQTFSALTHLITLPNLCFSCLMDSVYVSSDLQGALGMPRSFQRGGYKGTGHLAVFDKQQNPPCGSKVKAAMTREFNTGGHAVKVPRRFAMVFFRVPNGGRHDMSDSQVVIPSAGKKRKASAEAWEIQSCCTRFFLGLVSNWSRKIQMRWEMMWRRIRSEFPRIFHDLRFLFGFAGLIGTQGQSWARGGKRQWWWCCKLNPH